MQLSSLNFKYVCFNELHTSTFSKCRYAFNNDSWYSFDKNKDDINAFDFKSKKKSAKIYPKITFVHDDTYILRFVYIDASLITLYLIVRGNMIVT